MRIKYRILPVFLLVPLTAALFPASSWTQAPLPQQKVDAQTPPPIASPVMPPSLLSIRALEREGTPEFALGNTLDVVLDKDNLAPLKKLATPSKPIGLFLNGLFMPGIPDQPDPNNPDALRFHLQYTSVNRDVWSQLFARKISGSGDTDKVSVTVGLADGSVVATNAQTLSLEFLPDLKAHIILFLSIILVVITLALGRWSSMLRDSGAPRIDGRLGTYSLGRSQMALWFSTIVFSFLFIFAVTGVAPPITQGALVLMGIGAATALGAVAIDANKRTATSIDLVQLSAEKLRLQDQIQVLSRQITAAQPNDPNLAALQAQQQTAQARVAEITTQLGQTGVAEVAVSEGLVKDLLTDINGINFNRLQIAMWTLVLWVLFLSSVFGKLTMTDFDSTQLALVGISGGTYLGFKLNEKQS